MPIFFLISISFLISLIVTISLLFQIIQLGFILLIDIHYFIIPWNFLPITNRNYNLINEINKPNKIVLWIHTTYIPSSSKYLLQLQLHQFIKIKLLQVIYYTYRIYTARYLLILFYVFIWTIIILFRMLSVGYLLLLTRRYWLLYSSL